MKLPEDHEDTLKLSLLGVISVVIAGITVSLLVPDNKIGRNIKFFLPIIVGLTFAAKIYFEELEKVKEKI